MTLLDQLKDVPFSVRVAETNAFVREIPYNDQTRKSSRLTIDLDKLANHALHNHYCIPFIRCPFPLNFDSLIIILSGAKIENQYCDDTKLKYLIGLLKKYPQGSNILSFSMLFLSFCAMAADFSLVVMFWLPLVIFFVVTLVMNRKSVISYHEATSEMIRIDTLPILY